MSRPKKDHQFSVTPLMSQQLEALQAMAGKSAYALLMEQGTGKTLTIIEEFLRLYAEGKIDAVVVIAPNGVHENWVLDELPKHVPSSVPMISAYFVTDPNRRERKALDALWAVRPMGDVPPLRVLSVSFDSLLVDRAFKFVEKFARSAQCYMVVDESQRIKGPNSRRTLRALNLRKHSVVRRICTGTVATNSPLDVFSQFQWLEDGILGTSSLTAFRAEYCELLPPGHGKLRFIVDRMARSRGGMTDKQKQATLERTQIVATDEMGRPKYKNLDNLHTLIAQHSFRKLKLECLDLPPKQYATRYFHLTPKQRAIYDRLAEELRYTLEDGRELMTSKLVAMGKLRQITSGFLLLRDGTISYIQDNPRIELLHDQVEGETQQGIIWAQYKEEIANVQAMLRANGFTSDVVNGPVPMKRRREIRQEFHSGNLQWIVAHPASMGTGHTMTAAQLVYYYSNGFNLEERLQSEDRTHRIGTVGTVEYRDLVAIDTRDDDVVWALQHKLDTAAMINGDPARSQR